MPSKYTCLNEHYLEPKALPPNMSIVYVMMSNHADGARAIPLYVGISSSPKFRFRQHHILDFHWGRFHRPAIIRIVAMGPTSGLNSAEQDLITRLSHSGTPLMNSYITDTRAESFQLERDMASMPVEDLIASLEVAGDGGVAITEWVKHWTACWKSDGHTLSQSETANSPLDALFVSASGTDIRKHSDYKWAPAGTSAAELCLFLSRQSTAIYTPSGIRGFCGVYLLTKIAGFFDPAKGYAEVTYSELTALTGVEKKNIAAALKGLIGPSGLWVSIPGFAKSPTKYFPLFVEGVAERYLALSALDASHELAA